MSIPDICRLLKEPIYHDIRRRIINRGIDVFGRKRKPKKPDFLSLPDDEKMKKLREIRLKLRMKMAEEKLWRSFIEAETLTINGKLVSIDELNEGLTLPLKHRTKKRKTHHLNLRTNVL